MRAQLLMACAALCILLPGVGAALEPQRERPVCQRLQRDITRLRMHMRHSNSNRQAERDRTRLQRLKTRYYRLCGPADR